MSAPWIKLDTGFMQHPKTCELLERPTGAKALASLLTIWGWAGGSDAPGAREGHITDAVMRRIGVPRSHAQALADVGFLHRNGTGRHIHDWETTQGALLDKRASDARRQAANRAAAKSKKEAT